MTQSDGWCVWITGLPGCGKSTIAKTLLDQLHTSDITAQIVSSDMLRRIMTPSPKYTEDERDMVYGALVFTSILLTQNSINVIIDATANRRRYREQAKRKIPKMIEAYIRCPLDICMQREMKRKKDFSAPNGIYVKAQRGESITVPGIGVPYEEPLNPEILVDSDKTSPEQGAQKILEVIMNSFASI